MPRYLITANYTAAGDQGLLQVGGSARRDSVTKMIEGLGGKVDTFDYAFGEDDVFVVIELPDNITAAAISLAIGASGLVTTRVTVLLTPEEIDAAAAKHADYHGPGQQ
ncbi:MAG: GYD domain-containing protein [Acidimicrobiia bacterium]